MANLDPSPVFARDGRTAAALAHYAERASHDVDEHATHISAWHQEYDQLSCGDFTGAVRELCVDAPRLQVFHEHTGEQTSQRCLPWRGAIWFGVPDASNNAPSGIPSSRRSALPSMLGSHLEGSIAFNTVCTLRAGMPIPTIALVTKREMLNTPSALLTPHLASRP